MQGGSENSGSSFTEKGNMDLEDDFERANYNEQPKPLPLDVKSGDAYVASILIYLVQNLRSTDIELLKQFLMFKTLCYSIVPINI